MSKPGFIFKSTGIVIKILERILHSNFKVIGKENIPDTPILFVANHFTRSETFILPYLLYRLTDKKVRSLADSKIFVGNLGKYLEAMGTISVTEPKRNNIIISDLVTGDHDWLIYPEGLMLKNKHVTKKSHYVIHTDKKPQRIYTGSAVLALKTELLKKEFLIAEDQQNFEVINKILQDYNLLNEANINPKPLYIVPITISFFPIRPGKNRVFSLIKKLVKNTSDRILEEIEIEANLLTDAEITIKFNPAINIYDYIRTERKLINKIPLLSQLVKNNLILNFFRYRLTHKFMSQIYENIIINFDHIFAASLYFWSEASISRNNLKNLIYINARDIKKLNKYHLHPSIDSKISRIFMSSNNIYYDSIIDLALSQGVLFKEHDIYKINHKKLNNPQEFHRDRLENTLKIFVNELVKFNDIIHIIKKNARLTYQSLNDKVFDILVRSDKKEYFHDYIKYFSQGESKARKYGTPYFLDAKSKIGIIICHGYKSSPEEVKFLAQFLYEAGFNIYAVRLKGHGTAPINLKYTNWEDWYDSFFRGYRILKQKSSHIIAVGFSTGGLLALMLAASKKHKISAVISINAALKLNDIRVNLVPTVHYWNEFLTLLHSKKGKKEFIMDKPENPHINYSKNYLKGVKELSDLMEACNKELRNIEIPSLIIQATNDPVVNPKSGEIIYNKITSANKKLLTPTFNNHVIIRPKQIKLFQDIKKFIDNHVK
jgi:esterase/lipase/1-acyl-sn-glycerol-3-phosphate acyltransferase